MPNGVLLCQLVLGPEDDVVASGDDIKNYFYCLRHHPAWLARNIVGNVLSGADFSDLGVDTKGKFFLAFRVVCMGDVNAVDIAQETHLQLLRDSGCMRPEETLVYGTTVPPSRYWEGLYIDDHLMFAVIRRGDPNDPALRRLREATAQSHAGYETSGLERSLPKTFTEQEQFVAWGTGVDSKSGRVGVPLPKMAAIWGLLYRTLFVPCITRRALEKLIGLVVHPPGPPQRVDVPS